VSKRWPDKVIIGLTGNIATGKSAVMRMAGDQGALTLDADKVVHQILATNQEAQAAIIKQYGDEVTGSDGRINRAALAAVVFRDDLALRALEKILHPIVRSVIFAHVNDNDANVVMIEAIKLLEGNLAKECDQIWVTRCPKVKQIERLMVCRGMDSETAAIRVNAQSSQEQKVAVADVVIDTNGTMADTRQLFDIAWERIVQQLSGDIQPASAVMEIEPAPSPKSELEDEDSVEKAERIQEMDQEQADDDEIVVKAPPERLSGSKAAELRKRMLAKRKAAEGAAQEETAAQPEDAPAISANDIIVRRARPSDVPSILLLIQRATSGAVKIKRGELLMALGDRGYLIGQQGSDISAVFGWNSENLIARIDQIYVYPPESAHVAGPAILKEIEETALSLMCEVILAFPSDGLPAPIMRLFLDKDFEEVDFTRLPDAWQAAASESQPDNTFILMKKLRDTRVMKPV
jgi:dephospho-CoA kinase